MIRIHKQLDPAASPRLSIILLDWSCRERFHTLRWLADQNVPRSSYELVWVELHDRVPPEALEGADTVITCHQRGLYHKHLGYNVGLLHSRGRLLTICDSDACFPPDFVASIFRSFDGPSSEEDLSRVLMHYQWRTGHLYPDDLRTVEQMDRYRWRALWPNVGACMTVRRHDAVRFGGFDEHPSFRGYMCGPYDLGWRLVNAGIEEVWHDPEVASWHFAHPDPWFTGRELFNWSRWREKAYPHVDGHALTAVEAFSTGRLLPLRENPRVFERRMASRRVGTEFEAKYASMTPRSGFSALERWTRRGQLWLEPIKKVSKRLWQAARGAAPATPRDGSREWLASGSADASTPANEEGGAVREATPVKEAM